MKTPNVLIALFFLSATTLLKAAVPLTNAQSFTPVSYVYPIISITLQSKALGKSAVIYSCTGTEDECSVDLLDPVAVDALFAKVTTGDNFDYDSSGGAFDYVYIEVCKAPNYFHHVKAKGTYQAGDKTYYTSSTGTGLTTVLAEYGPVTLEMKACGGGGPIPSGFTIAPDELFTMTLYVTLKNAMWGATDGVSSGLGGCKTTVKAENAPDLSGTGICTTMPSVVPAAGVEKVSSETFLISTEAGDSAATKANGQIIVFMDSAGKLVGGSCRPYYSPTMSTATAVYDSGWLDWSLNADGSVKFTTDGRLAVDSFARKTHSGTMKLANGATATYYAVKQ